MNNIRLRRKALGLTLAEVAKQVGVRDATIQRYESGEIRTIKPEIVDALCRVLDCTPHYLLGYGSLPTRGAVRVPVLGYIPAGIPIEAIEDVLDYEEIPAAWTEGGREYFGLRIKGDSMFPEYRDGDTIIFRKQETCDNNEDCAVLVNGNDATFKRVERHQSGIVLKPLNPQYESRFFSNAEIEEMPVRILGVFWELRRSRRTTM
ncbi:MAG: helix-turn-helix domain-containing protein [Ruminococcaceae bacterium]|nr:helix-turn-helix domain-containing protein [Oscillospiraceae bacterium]